MEVIEIMNMLENIGIKLSYRMVDVKVLTGSECMNRFLSQEEDELRKRFHGDLTLLRKDPRIEAFRKTMWRLGFDPTKIRPSMEALARRVLRGKPLPRINCVVDAGNAASLHYLVPIGLYDIERVPERILRFQLLDKEAVFEPIGGDKRLLKPGTPVLRSGERVLHIYPSRDSRYTMITANTAKLLIVAYGAFGIGDKLLEDAVEMVEELLRRCGCTV